MNKLLCFVMVFGLSGCCSWCIPEQASITAKENAEISDAFVQFMDAGATTRVQEQNFIKACRRAWHAQNFAINSVPLPPDVDAWHAQRKLGMAHDGSPAAPEAPDPRRARTPR